MPCDSVRTQNPALTPWLPSCDEYVTSFPGDPADSRHPRSVNSRRRFGTRTRKKPGTARVPGLVRGDGGNRTPVRCGFSRASPGAVCVGVYRPWLSCRQAASPGLAGFRSLLLPPAGATDSGYLIDARIRDDSIPGLTDSFAVSGSESEVSALRFGTYWVAEDVYEMTLHSRPASPAATHIVETDHPRVELSNSPCRKGRTSQNSRCRLIYQGKSPS